MTQMTIQQRKDRLKKRTQKVVAEKGKSGLKTKKYVLDFNKSPFDVEMFDWKTSDGNSKQIDLLPFEITESWYKNLKTKSGTLTDMDIGDWDYKLELPIHQYVGENNEMFVCLNLAFGKPCPLCEELFAEWAKPEAEQDQPKIESLKVSWRCYYNAYDYNGKLGSVELWTEAYANFEEVLAEETETDSDGLVIFWSPYDGRTIEYQTREKKIGKSSYHVANKIKFLPREAYDETIVQKTHPLDKMLIIPTYEFCYKCLHEEGGDEDLPDSKRPETGARRPRAIGKVPAEEVIQGKLNEDLPIGASGRRQRPIDSATSDAGNTAGQGLGRGRQRMDAPVPVEEVIPERGRQRMGAPVPVAGNRRIDEKASPVCLTGGKFGIDCNKLKICEACGETLYNACADVALGSADDVPF